MKNSSWDFSSTVILRMQDDLKKFDYRDAVRHVICKFRSRFMQLWCFTQICFMMIKEKMYLGLSLVVVSPWLSRSGTNNIYIFKKNHTLNTTNNFKHSKFTRKNDIDSVWSLNKLITTVISLLLHYDEPWRSDGYRLERRFI